MKQRTPAEEKAACLRVARMWLDGESREITVSSLAILLFEQREAARSFPDAVQKHSLCFDEIEVE